MDIPPVRLSIYINQTKPTHGSCYVTLSHFASDASISDRFHSPAPQSVFITTQLISPNARFLSSSANTQPTAAACSLHLGQWQTSLDVAFLSRPAQCRNFTTGSRCLPVSIGCCHLTFAFNSKSKAKPKSVPPLMWASSRQLSLQRQN